MTQYRFDVVYETNGAINEARFLSESRDQARNSATAFADMLERQGTRFRVWSNEGQMTRQFIGGRNA